MFILGMNWKDINTRLSPPQGIFRKRQMPTNFWSTILTSFRWATGTCSPPSVVPTTVPPDVHVDLINPLSGADPTSIHPELHEDGLINRLPSEVILIVADNLPGFTDLKSFMRTNLRHYQLLMPIFLDRAIAQSCTSHFGNRTVLHWAVAHNVTTLFPRLLQRPLVDTILNLRDYHGATPLHTATFYTTADVVELLLNRGANPNTRLDDELGDGWTPLHVAAWVGGATLTQLLLAAGADPEARTCAGGNTPLFICGLLNQTTCWRALVQGGANTFACRKDGSNVNEYVQRCRSERLLATIPTLVYERLMSFEWMCRCWACTRNGKLGDGSYPISMKTVISIHVYHMNDLGAIDASDLPSASFVGFVLDYSSAETS